MSSRNLLRLSTSLAMSISAAFLSFVFINKKTEVWLNSLQVPSYLPNKYSFILISVLLILGSGWALYLAWKNNQANKGPLKIIITYFLPLAFTVFWSFIFFYLQNLHLAFLTLVLLLIFLLTMAIKFYSLNKITVYLLSPYIVWVIFIAYFNYRLWLLN